MTPEEEIKELKSRVKILEGKLEVEVCEKKDDASDVSTVEEIAEELVSRVTVMEKLLGSHSSSEINLSRCEATILLKEKLQDEINERQEDITEVREELDEIPVNDIIIANEQLDALLRFLEDQGMNTLLIRKELGISKL